MGVCGLVGGCGCCFVGGLVGVFCVCVCLCVRVCVDVVLWVSGWVSFVCVSFVRVCLLCVRVFSMYVLFCVWMGVVLCVSVFFMCVLFCGFGWMFFRARVCVLLLYMRVSLCVGFLLYVRGWVFPLSVCVFLCVCVLICVCVLFEYAFSLCVFSLSIYFFFKCVRFLCVCVHDHVCTACIKPK